MISLPSELRLNILEYGGDTSLWLDIKDIIERIKQYDPSFDHDQWMNKVDIKMRFIRGKYIPLMDIYNIVKKNNLSIDRKDNDLIICGMLENLDSAETIIVNAIAMLGYNIQSRSQKENQYSENIYETHITIDNIDSLMKDIMSIWVYRYNNSNRSESYPYSIYKSKEKGYGSLIPILDSLDIPITLNDYLRYSVRRKREENQMKKFNGYHLYELIRDTKWELIPPCHTEPYEFVINESISPDSEDEIREELNGWLRETTVNKYEWEYEGVLFTISNHNISELIKIDIFYHPHIIPLHFFDEIC